MKNDRLRREEITSEEQAFEALDDPLEDQLIREKAIRYLSTRPNEHVIKKLVQALQDDDFGVRWEAAVALAQFGEKALPELLEALTDPERVSDPRLREGVYHVLHNTSGALHYISVAMLVRALKGPAADIAVMDEAGKLLLQLKARER